jgi:hypothetical protein
VILEKSIIPETTNAEEKVKLSKLFADYDTTVEKLLVDHDDAMASYESQYTTYKTWIDEDARTASILVVGMEDLFFADIVELDYAQQMWDFLRKCYEPSG